MTARRRSYQLTIIALCFALFGFWRLSRWDSRQTVSSLPADDTRQHATDTAQHTTAESHLPCRSLPGADETLVVLRTGATELQDRFPIHLATTLKCYPHYMLFSDHEEVYRGEQVNDALATVNQEILTQHPDFELHRRLKESGREVLLANELSGSESEAIQWTGKSENPGWKLDKWKFLPMVNQTLHEYPYMKWYVFVEADTYVLWASLLEYLKVLDHTKPVYTGSQMYIGDVVFAHGGSGFIVSQPAMRMVVDHYAAHKSELEAFTDGHWAGDCVLGKAFRDAGVKFVDAWPIMQGDYPGTVPYARPDGRPIADPTKRVWCYPTVSYHHLSPDVVEDLWHFEQDWIADNRSANHPYLRHKDIFAQYIVPRMSSPRADWDSESDWDQGIVELEGDCAAKCDANDECRQWSVDHEKRCKIRADPRLGKAAPGFKSGWLEARMRRFERDMAACGSEGWLV